MSDYVTQVELQKGLRAQTDEIVGIMQTFAAQMDHRFTKLEKSMDVFELRLQKLTETLDGFISRIDHYETEMVARDRQFERLLEWARKVSEKTGIPLENL